MLYRKIENLVPMEKEGWFDFILDNDFLMGVLTGVVGSLIVFEIVQAIVF